MKPSKCRIMCPDCGRPKMQFGSEKEAKTFIKFNGNEISDNPDELRIYYCNSCCCYHISSKPFKKSYNYRTDNLIKRYYDDIKDEDKVFIMSEIKKFFLLDTSFKIVKTGTKKIVTFGLINNMLYGFDEKGNSFDLFSLQMDELKSMFNKVKKIYKK